MGGAGSGRRRPGRGLEGQLPERLIDERLLTTREVADFLGVHEKTVRRWQRAGGLPCVRQGRWIRYQPVDVLRWISARKEG